MDGYGISEKVNGNCVLKANKPNLDKFFTTRSTTLIEKLRTKKAIIAPDMIFSRTGNLGVIKQMGTRISASVPQYTRGSPAGAYRTVSYDPGRNLINNSIISNLNPKVQSALEKVVFPKDSE